MKNKPRLGDLKTSEGVLVQGDKEKADLLNKYFASVYTQEKLENQPSLESKYDGPPLSKPVITADTASKKLLKLNVNKAKGPDGLHPRVLRETAASITQPLCAIFQKSIDSSCLPTSWKTGNITPIHKKGRRTAVGNYRPVSLTSVVGKLMESLVRDHLVEHMMRNKLFCDAQHGFVPGRSCMTKLLVVIEL